MPGYKSGEYITGGEELILAATSGVYESVATQEKLDQVRRRHQPAHPNKKQRSAAAQRKNILITLIVVILLAVSVAVLVVPFLQSLNNRYSNSQLKNKMKRNKTSQLIDSLQQKMDTLKTRLRQSERDMETLSATCEGLGFSVAEINNSVQTVKNREALAKQKIDTIKARLAAVNTSLLVINTTMQTINKKVNENSQNISRNHPQDPKCLLSEYQQNPYSNTCYRVVKVHKNWTDARDYCTASGEYFATFVTTESVEWFASMRTADAWGVGANPLWVGGYKYSSGWKWTGRFTVPFNSAFWAPGQPNEPVNCMYSHPSSPYNRIWDDSCSDRYYFVCETA